MAFSDARQEFIEENELGMTFEEFDLMRREQAATVKVGQSWAIWVCPTHGRQRKSGRCPVIAYGTQHDGSGDLRCNRQAERIEVVPRSELDEVSASLQRESDENFAEIERLHAFLDRAASGGGFAPLRAMCRSELADSRARHGMTSPAEADSDA